MQCTGPEILRLHNLRSHAYPFDWVLSTPKFVYQLLLLLLEIEMPVEQIVNDYFLQIDKKVDFKIVEQYYCCDNGVSLCNTKYNVVFPHDKLNDDTRAKYMRRFQRLKDVILNENEKICFIYTSQSSLKNGNYTIEDKNILTDVYLYLNLIYELIKRHRSDFHFYIFDSIHNEDKSILNKNIRLFELSSCYDWGEMVKQMNFYVKHLQDIS